MPRLLKCLVGLGLLVVIAAIVALFSLYPTEQKLPAQGLSAICGSGGVKYTVRLRSQLKINHDVLGRVPKTQDIDSAVDEQLGFLRGVFFNHFNRQSQHMAFSDKGMDLKISRAEEVDYGLDLVIDMPESNPDVPSKSYIELAKKRGFTRANDRATLVDYQVDLEALGCGFEQGGEFINVDPILPIDPYLAYWSVPPEQRVRKTWRSSSSVVNPCSINELADFPSPEYFWYFYLPYSKSCRSHAIDGSWTTGQLSSVDKNDLPSTVMIDVEKLSKRREIRMRLIFGYVVHNEQYVSPKVVAEALQNNLSHLDPAVTHWDTSSRQFLWFWNRLETIARVQSVSLRPFENGLTAEVHGQFNGSEKNFLLNIYLGPTDLYGPIQPEHWESALAGMLSDDVFIYAGHSGLGENLRVARIMDRPFPARSLARAPEYQIFGYLSCYSYTYFDQGIFPTHPWFNVRSQADLFLTAGMTYEFGLATFSMFSLISESLKSNGTVDLKDRFPKNSFLVHRSFKHTRTNGRVSMR